MNKKLSDEEIKALKDVLELQVNPFPLTYSSHKLPRAFCTGCGRTKPFSRMLFINHTPDCPHKRYWEAMAIVSKMVSK